MAVPLHANTPSGEQLRHNSHIRGEPYRAARLVLCRLSKQLFSYVPHAAVPQSTGVSRHRELRESEHDLLATRVA